MKEFKALLFVVMVIAAAVSLTHLVDKAEKARIREVINEAEAERVSEEQVQQLFENVEIVIAGRVVTLEQFHLITAMAVKESGLDQDARGDYNEETGEYDAIGLMQIQPIMVEDCNRIVGKQRWTLEDRWDPDQSMLMFFTYTDHYTPTWEPELVARRWNGGPRGDRKDATLEYWTDVQRLMEEQR